MTKEKVCFDNKLLSCTNMNKRWTSKTNFFFTWFTQELDYKVKCTALTVLKIISKSKSWLLKSYYCLLWHLIWKQRTLIQFKFIIFLFLLLQMNIKNGPHFNCPRFPNSSLLDGWGIAGWGGGGGVLYRVLYKDAPPWGPTPYPKQNPFQILSIKKMVPLSHT